MSDDTIYATMSAATMYVTININLNNNQNEMAC